MRPRPPVDDDLADGAGLPVLLHRDRPRPSRVPNLPHRPTSDRPRRGRRRHLRALRRARIDFTCRQRGRSGNPFGHGRCAHCVLRDRLEAPLTGPDGTVPTQLRPVVETIGKAEAPFSAIRWIKASPNARLLAQLAADGRPISHELLNELPPDRNQRYVPQVLLHTGVLPERREDLERIPGWPEHELLGRPAAHAILVQPFMHWFLLRRAHRQAATLGSSCFVEHLERLQEVA